MAFPCRDLPIRRAAVDRQSAMKMHSPAILSAIRDMWQSILEEDGLSMRPTREPVSATEMQLTVRSLRFGVCCRFVFSKVKCYNLDRNEIRDGGIENAVQTVTG